MLSLPSLPRFPCCRREDCITIPQSLIFSRVFWQRLPSFTTTFVGPRILFVPPPPRHSFGVLRFFAYPRLRHGVPLRKPAVVLHSLSSFWMFCSSPRRSPLGIVFFFPPSRLTVFGALKNPFFLPLDPVPSPHFLEGASLFPSSGTSDRPPLGPLTPLLGFFEVLWVPVTPRPLAPLVRHSVVTRSPFSIPPAVLSVTSEFDCYQDRVSHLFLLVVLPCG